MLAKQSGSATLSEIQLDYAAKSSNPWFQRIAESDAIKEEERDYDAAGVAVAGVVEYRQGGEDDDIWQDALAWQAAAKAARQSGEVEATSQESALPTQTEHSKAKETIRVENNKAASLEPASVPASVKQTEPATPTQRILRSLATHTQAAENTQAVEHTQAAAAIRVEVNGAPPPKELEHKEAGPEKQTEQTEATSRTAEHDEAALREASAKRAAAVRKAAAKQVEATLQTSAAFRAEAALRHAIHPSQEVAFLTSSIEQQRIAMLEELDPHRELQSLWPPSPTHSGDQTAFSLHSRAAGPKSGWTQKQISLHNRASAMDSRKLSLEPRAISMDSRAISQELTARSDPNVGAAGVSIQKARQKVDDESMRMQALHAKYDPVAAKRWEREEESVSRQQAKVEAEAMRMSELHAECEAISAEKAEHQQARDSQRRGANLQNTRTKAEEEAANMQALQAEAAAIVAERMGGSKYLPMLATGVHHGGHWIENRNYRSLLQRQLEPPKDDKWSPILQPTKPTWSRLG